MATGLAQRRAFSIEPISYPVIAEKIEELAAEYMPLRINGLDDSRGLKEVHSARMVVRTLRVNVEKRRKELKESALKYGREVDAAAKQLFDLLEPIESHLRSEEDAVENEKGRIKQEAEEAKRQELQGRMDGLLRFGVVGNPVEVGAMTEEEFGVALGRAKKAYDLHTKEQAEAEAKRRAEEAALQAERERLDGIRRQQESEAARLEAEKQKLADQEAARKREAELEEAKRQAAEKARLETEQRIAREQAEAAAAAERKAAQEKADAEAKEAARLKAEAEKPYREKLLTIAQSVEQIGIPPGTESERVRLLLAQCAGKIRAIANGPLKS